MVDHLEQQFQALGAQESVTPDYPDQDHVLIIEDDHAWPSSPAIIWKQTAFK